MNRNGIRPVSSSDDYKRRITDKPTPANGMPKVSLSVTDEYMNYLWAFIPLNEKAQLIQRWLDKDL